jgi:hypothetical protein
MMARTYDALLGEPLKWIAYILWNKSVGSGVGEKWREE